MRKLEIEEVNHTGEATLTVWGLVEKLKKFAPDTPVSFLCEEEGYLGITNVILEKIVEDEDTIYEVVLS